MKLKRLAEVDKTGMSAIQITRDPIKLRNNAEPIPQ